VQLLEYNTVEVLQYFGLRYVVSVKIGTPLQWKADRKSYAIYQTVLFPVTWSDPNSPNHLIFYILHHLYNLYNG